MDKINSNRNEPTSPVLFSNTLLTISKQEAEVQIEGVECLPESDYQYSSTSQYNVQLESPMQKDSKAVGSSTRRSVEYVAQMSERIRHQAKQLIELEAYKALCERRILELCPGHPLPIQKSNLGQG